MLLEYYKYLNNTTISNIIPSPSKYKLIKFGGYLDEI